MTAVIVLVLKLRSMKITATDNEDTKIKVADKRAAIRLEIVRNWFDLWIPLHSTWFVTNNGWVGFTGLLASCIGCYETWPGTK